MLRSAVLILASVSISSTAVAAPAPAALVNKAKAIIAKRLIDPDSLQVRSTRLVTASVNGKSQQVLCGEFNSKNRMGGYAGFETFAYEPTILKGVLSFDGEKFSFYGVDGAGEMSHQEVFANAETTASIIAPCLG